MNDMTMPTSLGKCVDLYAETRDLRLAMQKEVDEVARRERELQDHIINNLSREESGIAGARYKAIRKESRKPKVEDWDKFYDYVAENDRFDLMQKRLSDKAVMDMLEAEEKVPGVGTFTAISLSVTKI